MKSYMSLKSVLAEFFPLHRTLASDGHNKTLEIVGERCGLKSSLSTWKPFGLMGESAKADFHELRQSFSPSE